MKTTLLMILLYLYFRPNLDKIGQGKFLLWFWNWKRDERKYLRLWYENN